MHLVLLRPTILTIVLVRTLTLVKDPHTASMLPDTAAITLDEEAARVVGLSLRSAVSLAERRTGVFLLSAKTSGDLLFVLGGFLVGVLRGGEDFRFGGGVGALAAAGRFAHFLAGSQLRRGGFGMADATASAAIAAEGGLG